MSLLKWRWSESFKEFFSLSIFKSFKMSPRTSESSRGLRNVKWEGTNWVVVAGSALLSTLSIRLGFKLKQVFDAKQLESSRRSLKENGKHGDRKKSASCHLHSNAFCFPQDEGCCNHYSGIRNPTEIKQPLPLVTVSNSEFNKSNSVIWPSSPDLPELPQKPFNHSNSSDSLCISESSSDIFSKREVIQKLRLQLKRRDDMILEMQYQISELQNSLNSQLSHSSHLQSLLDSSNRNIFDSDNEIQRLRKAIADHCVGNGYVNGYSEVESSSVGSAEKGGEKVEMLKREVNELKELIEGKDYLVQSYKEQKCEMSVKLKELQQRLDSQVLNIL